MSDHRPNVADGQVVGDRHLPDDNATRLERSRMISIRQLSIAIGVAIVLNLVVFGIGSAAGATWLANGQTVAWYLVIIATAIAMTIGAIITWLLTKRWTKSRTVMAWVGLIFGVVTMPSPLLATENRPTGMALAAMHLITGVVWFVAVRPRRDASSS